jgi:hypothetical protein
VIPKLRGVPGDARRGEGGRVVTLTLPTSATALLRREQLLNAWPHLRISAGTGYWQAEINEPRGQRVITRYGLGELLDRVESMLTRPDG